jgi:hypothetical protein
MVDAAMKHDYVAEIALILALGMMIRGLLILLAEILKERK